ncbi:uncharacterized protein LOC113005730 isoform X2 [Solenopsis invicta]|uniref:uncharacterized protein LOC113005730 isoform X2 n=1 Tax=Solenopsis invicta TaxID=13686 RepID=UPI00193D9DC8|nr:uncharacterized protein LOC113005730 isoform X2 [Solenopsis invicta]XP_039307918.1 uncharacterized protein LOC113005730 isoform X2 [Solenopsis invicta]
MTFTSLINFGGFGKNPWDTSIERYNDGSYHHGYRGSKGKGGSNAALSALTLLAFLFLLNVMQQSLQENNSTLVPTTTTLLLRETELPIVLDNGEEKKAETKNNFAHTASPYASKATAKDYTSHKD